MTEDSHYISVKDCVANAAMQLNISHSSEENYLTLKALEAEGQILSAHTLIRKIEPLDIENYTAQLPYDLHTLISLRLSGDDGYVYPRYAKKSFFKYLPDCLNTIESALPYTFDIEDYTVYFSTDITATECEISYIGFNTDEDGLPKIHHSHEVAIVNYICWQYATKDFDRFPAQIREMYRLKWEQKCNQTRSRSKQRGQAEKEYHKIIWNNMLRPHRHRF